MGIRARLRDLRPVLALALPSLAVLGGLTAGAWISGPASTDARIEKLQRVRPSTWFDAGDIALRADRLYLCENTASEQQICLDIAVANHAAKPIEGTMTTLPDHENLLYLMTFGGRTGTPADGLVPDSQGYLGAEQSWDAWVNPGLTEQLTLRWDLDGQDASQAIGSSQRIFLSSTFLHEMPQFANSPYFTVPEPAGYVILPLESGR